MNDSSPRQGKLQPRRPRILSLSCAYPNPVEPGLGVFVQRRLQHLAALTEVEIIAPFPLLRYGGAKGKRIRLGKRYCPSVRQDGTVEVRHPRWFYPPLGGSLTAIWLFLQLVYPLARLRKKFRFEVMDTHFGHPDGITGALLSLVLRVPFTVTLRGNEPTHSRRGLSKYFMKWAVRRASRVFTVSRRLRDFAIGLGADPEKVKVIPNGVEVSNFFPREKTACRIKYGFELDLPLIVSAGALIERKGHHRIIRALERLAKSGTPARLAIAGGAGPDGDYESKIRRMASELGIQDSVVFLGAISPEAMAEVMSAADVFCLASTREGWPNVVHEALACGTPVVATDVGAVPDLLPDTAYGLIVPIDDQASLQAALQTALQMDWDRPRIAAWGQRRSWQQVAREVFDEMQNIVAEQEGKAARL